MSQNLYECAKGHRCITKNRGPRRASCPTCYANKKMEPAWRVTCSEDAVRLAIQDLKRLFANQDRTVP